LFDRSVQLDPRSASADGYPMALVTLGRKDEAIAAFSALSRARPDEIGLAIAPGYVAMNFSCDLDTFGRVLAQVAARAPGSQAMAQDQAYYALMTGHFDDAVQSAARMPVSAEEIDVELIWLKGLAYRLAGRQKESSELLQRNLRAYEREMQSIPESNVPSDWFAAIAMRRALLGQKQEAREYAARALRALPPSGDAVNRTVTTYYTAVALAWADDPEQAVANLREMLSAPSLYKPAYLWCDPYLAPLRKEPSFRKLLADRGVDLGIDPYRRETWPKH
jgi:tetratricopeptide (TPR) repeat protein